jgi:molecular chaperone DnaK (HSP70)
MDADPGINAMTAIGEGAGIAAAIMSGQLKDSDFFVCLEHALGTWITDPNTGNKYFSTIIPRGHKLPARKAEQFHPLHPEHGKVTIEVVEGNPDSKVPDWTVLMEWEVDLHEPYEEGSPRDFSLEYSYDVDGILQVEATDNASGSTLLDEDISYGVARDKRELKKISDRVKAAVATGTIDQASRVQVTDPEAVKLIEQVRVKILPFLDPSEQGPIEASVTRLESSSGAHDTESIKSELRRLIAPFSYLI